MMRGIALALAIVGLGVLASSAHAQPLCPGETFGDMSLFILEPAAHCWKHVEDRGAWEPRSMADLTDSNTGQVTQVPFGGGKAHFLLALRREPGYESAVVIKERMFQPASITTDAAHNVRGASPTGNVRLDRPLVQNTCGRWEKLRNGSAPVNVYNRYHMDTTGAIPLSGDLRKLHYKYGRDCSRSTNDIASGNRAEFAFRELNVDQPSDGFLTSFSFGGTAYAANNVYTRLRVKNAYIQPERAEPATADFAAVRFTSEVDPYESTLLSAIDLEKRDSSDYKRSRTWHIEWTRPR
jgi:hypothetical protein